MNRVLTYAGLAIAGALVAGASASAQPESPAVPAGAVMLQTEFPCHEDQALMYHPVFGSEHVGCVQLDDIGRQVSPVPDHDVEVRHGVKRYHRPLADTSQPVKPRALARYIATHPREMNVGPWHTIARGSFKGCVQHVGDTTWLVCRDGRVFAS